MLFILFQTLLVRPRSWLLYFIFCSPALAIQSYLHVIGWPEYSHDGFLRRPGQDMDARGLTEYMWDVVYWTWINVPLVLTFGNGAWWLYAVVPAYTIYLAATTVGGLKAMLSPPQDDGDATATGAESKRQQKLGKRAQQRMAYQDDY
jgi:SRP-independent targeting protein 2/TMEM208